MIMNLSGGGNPKNVLVVSVGEASATITVTDGATTLTKASDASGYAYFKNLDEGTWTVTAVNSSSHIAPLTPTVTITSTQTAYYVRLGFEFYLYDNTYADKELNKCTANSGGWTIYGTAGVNCITTNTSGGGYARPNNSFDSSQYDTLALYYNCANGNSNGMAIRLSDNTVVASISGLNSTTPTWATIDISGLSYQNTYINIGAAQYDVMNIYKVYLA